MLLAWMQDEKKMVKLLALFFSSLAAFTLCWDWKDAEEQKERNVCVTWRGRGLWELGGRETHRETGGWEEG